MGYGQEADGTHATGMHSCFCVRQRRWINASNIFLPLTQCNFDAHANVDFAAHCEEGSAIGK